MNPFLEAARGYLAAGLHPLPCQPRGKVPMLPAWKQYQTTAPTPEELTAWWTLWPDANVALVLGRGVFAIDIDSVEGRERLLAAGVVLPADAPSVTTGKGAHVYMAGTTGDRVGLVKGVDVRGVGYVIAPPSIHPTGAEYKWAVPFGALPPAPHALLSLLGRPTEHAVTAASGADWLTQALVGVAEGGRDHTCTRLAGYLLGKGLPQDAVELILQGWAERCTPAFPADQVSKCVASIAKREGVIAPEGLPPSASDLVAPTMALISAPARPVRSTGLAALDALLDGGLEPGTVTLLGARPGVGKTALLLQIARTVALTGQGVFFLTREMGATRLMRRVLSQTSGVRFKSIKTGKLVDIEWKMLAAAAEGLHRLPLWVETRVATVEAFDEMLGRFDAGQLGLAVVDYLQKMHGPVGGDKRTEVEHVSDALARVAVARDIPIIAASSLSRPPKASPNWRPSLSDLRESGALEHDGDNVLLAHRDIGSDVLELQLAKQRDGETGSMELMFRGEILTFEARK